MIIISEDESFNFKEKYVFEINKLDKNCGQTQKSRIEMQKKRKSITLVLQSNKHRFWSRNFKISTLPVRHTE